MLQTATQNVSPSACSISSSMVKVDNTLPANLLDRGVYNLVLVAQIIRADMDRLGKSRSQVGREIGCGCSRVSQILGLLRLDSTLHHYLDPTRQKPEKRLSPEIAGLIARLPKNRQVEVAHQVMELDKVSAYSFVKSLLGPVHPNRRNGKGCSKIVNVAAPIPEPVSDPVSEPTPPTPTPIITYVPEPASQLELPAPAPVPAAKAQVAIVVVERSTPEKTPLRSSMALNAFIATTLREAKEFTEMPWPELNTMIGLKCQSERDKWVDDLTNLADELRELASMIKAQKQAVSSAPPLP